MNRDNKPNLVFVMVDDMGYGDASCYNSQSKISTPNIDRLAQEGLRFTDAHSSSAVCTPSRYSVLTGRYCWRTWRKRGVNGGFSLPLIEPCRETLATIARKAGYRTAAIGKWHVGLEWQAKTEFAEQFDPEEGSDLGMVDYSRPILDGPLQHGFEYFLGTAGSIDMPPYALIENDRTLGCPDIPKKTYYPQQRKGLQVEDWEERNIDLILADKACSFIEEHHKEPFLLYMTPVAPHRPCLPPDFAKGKSQAGNRGDMVWLVDWVLGKVMNQLQKCGIADNTIVCFTSDNGARGCDVDGEMWNHKSCGDLRGYKGDIWEGGHRVPFVIRWPQHIAANTVSDDVVGIFDIGATFADLLGIDLTGYQFEDAVSFRPILEGKEGTRRKMVHHAITGAFALRSDNWKYIPQMGSCGNDYGITFGSGTACENGPRGQLYDLATDRAEQSNQWLSQSNLVNKMADDLDGFKPTHPREVLSSRASGTDA